MEGVVMAGSVTSGGTTSVMGWPLRLEGGDTLVLMLSGSVSPSISASTWLLILVPAVWDHQYHGGECYHLWCEEVFAHFLRMKLGVRRRWGRPPVWTDLDWCLLCGSAL